MRYDSAIQGALAGIVLQLQAQWKTPDGKQRPPFECAKVIIYLYRKSARFDPDGQKATILDALKQAGVIVDDNAARVPDSRVVACRVENTERTLVMVFEMISPWPQPKRKRVPKAKQR